MGRIAVGSLLLALHLVAQPAAAVCLGSGEPQVEALVQEIGRHPARALEQIQRAIAQTPAEQPRTLAWLHSARAAAMGMLGQEDTDVSAALDRAERALPSDDPALFYLRVAELITVPRATDPRKAVEALKPALDRQPPRTEATVCVTASLAYFLSRAGHPQEAFPIAAEAYRISAEGNMAWAHAEAAAVLAQVTRFQADRDYAIALNTEALAYFSEAGMHDLVANELAMRGWARSDEQAPELLQSARADFVASGEAAVRAGNDMALAYAHSGLCSLLVPAKLVEEAGPACEAGYQALSGSGDSAEYGMTVSFAGYQLAIGRPGEALKLLDALLADGGDPHQSHFTYLAHQLRARAYAALGDHTRAFAEMQLAIDLLKRIEARQRARTAAVTRARFQTEQLTYSLARKTQEHQESLQRSWLIGGSGLVVLMLLGLIAYVMARHRRIYRRLAFTDPLTGLPNRRYTETRILEMLTHARARQQVMTLSLLDLDHFKGCNDRYGHEAGDEALCSFAAAAQQMLRPGDVFGRWGGEEFLLALADTDEERTSAILGRIRSAAAQVELSLAPDYALRFCAGTVSAALGDASLLQLLGAADRALYQAKSQGRNRDFFAPSIARA